jgi:hypothetical protein
LQSLFLAIFDFSVFDMGSLADNFSERPAGVVLGGASVLLLTASLEQDGFSSNRHLALSFCLSMIFSENRFPLFRIML